MTDREIIELARAQLITLGNLARDPSVARSLFERALELRAVVHTVNPGNTLRQILPHNALR